MSKLSTHLVLGVAFLGMLVLGVRVAAAGPLYTIQDCDAQFGKKNAACRKCVNSDGGVYSPKGSGWTCTKWKGPGLKPGMHKSEAMKAAPPPPIPKSMPATHKKSVTVPAGSFTIGEREDETYRQRNEYQSKVKITRPFLMKASEVTENEWYFVMKAPSSLYRRDCMDCPVTYVDWRQAIEYLNALSKLEKLDPCYEITDEAVTWKGLDCTGYRLPTEAEWEYAARAGTTEKTYGAIDDIAWHHENSDSKPHPGAGKQPNKFGLYDMLGNVSEWVWDLYEWAAFEKPQTDPVIGGFEARDVTERMVRGYTFMDAGAGMRVAYRDQRTPSNSKSEERGFRWVRSLPKGK